jgi:hypothetical protein
MSKLMRSQFIPSFHDLYSGRFIRHFRCIQYRIAVPAFQCTVATPIERPGAKLIAVAKSRADSQVMCDNPRRADRREHDR